MAPRVEVLERPLDAAVASARQRPDRPRAVRDGASHFGDAVRFLLDHPVAMRRLHAATGSLQGLDAIEVALPAALGRGIELVRADHGDLQLLDVGTGALLVVAHSLTDDRRGGQPHGLRAERTIPLCDYSGRVVGVVSTYWRRPHRAAAVDLRVFDLYADYVGQRLADLLAGAGARTALAPGTDADLGPLARAMIDALLVEHIRVVMLARDRADG
jgi:hypothetical protein